MPSLRQKWKTVKQRWKSNSDTNSNPGPSEHVELPEPSGGQAPIPPSAIEPGPSGQIELREVGSGVSTIPPAIDPDQPQASNEGVENDHVQSQQEAPIDSPTNPDSTSESVQETNPPDTQSAAETHQAPETPDLWAEAANVLTDSEKLLLAKLQSEAGIEGSTVIQVNNLIELTKLKQAECEQKRWKFKLGDQEVVLRDVAETAISWLNTFKEVGDIAVQFDTTGAALPWAGFRFLVQVRTLVSILTPEIMLTNSTSLLYVIVTRWRVYWRQWRGSLERRQGAEYTRPCIRRLRQVKMP